MAEDNKTQGRRRRKTKGKDDAPALSPVEARARADKLEDALVDRDIESLLWWIMEDHKQNLLLRKPSPHGSNFLLTVTKELISLGKGKSPSGSGAGDESSGVPKSEAEVTAFLTLVKK